MRVGRFLSRGRLADLGSTDLRGALAELLELSAVRFRDLKQAQLLDGLIERENVITTYLGHGVALPHIRIRMSRPFVLAIGRSRAGIAYKSLNGVESVHLIFMLLASEQTKDYLQMLGSIARAMRDRDLVDQIVGAPDLDGVYNLLLGGFGAGASRPVRGRKSRMNRLILAQAARIARGADCSALMVFGDTMDPGFDWGAAPGALRTILVTSSPDAAEAAAATGRFQEVITVRAFARARLAQLRSALLVGMTRRLIQFRDRICGVGGLEGSDLLDTIVVVDVEREFANLLTDPANLLPPDVKPEVFERVLATATELAVEGREGRPVGCFFVLGDAARVEKLAKPLVLNPFFGYKDEDRNVLNPFMDETLKEFSSLDGAWVIRGDGVVLSAGSLIQATDQQHALPSGLGARHAAAAAISKQTDSVAIVVSSSTGQVTVFRRGLMAPLLDPGLGAR